MAQAVAPIKACDLFDFGVFLESGGIWEEAGDRLTRIGGKDWVF